MAVLVLVGIAFVFAFKQGLDKKGEENKIEVPDVSGLTIEQATELLEKEGFTVESDVKIEYSETVLENRVIRIAETELKKRITESIKKCLKTII